MIKELLEAMNLVNRVRYAEVNSQSWYLTSERMAAENRDLRAKLEAAEHKVADSVARAERSARCAARQALIRVSTEKRYIPEREMERIEAQVFNGWFEPTPSEANGRRSDVDRERAVRTVADIIGRRFPVPGDGATAIAGRIIDVILGNAKAEQQVAPEHSETGTCWTCGLTGPRCGSKHDEHNSCHLPAGHTGKHRDGDRLVWSDDEAQAAQDCCGEHRPAEREGSR